MRRAFCPLPPTRPRAGALLALAAAIALGALPARADAPGRPVLVAAPGTDDALAPLALGYAEWLRQRFRGAGFRVSEADAARDTRELLATAVERGAAYAVLPDLALEDGRVEVALRLYAPEAGELLALTRAQAPLVELGSACEDTVQRALGHLGVAPSSLPDAPPPLVDELSASHRALRARRRGQLARAWQQVQGKLTPTAMRLREEIVAEARRPGGATAERARVLAYTGDVPLAWSLIAPELAGAADPAARIAAGEIRLAQGDPRGARGEFEAALRGDPERPAANAGLARALELQGDASGARDAWRRVAEFEPADPLPLERLAELEPDRERRAGLWIAAGRRAAARLDLGYAQRHYARAAEDGTVAAARSAEGALRLRSGDPDGASAAYAQALAAGAADPQVLVGAGRARRALGDAAGAEDAFRRALARDADQPRALRELGVLYGESGRAAEAVPMLERALEAAGDDPPLRHALARALRASGDTSRAVAVLSSADPGVAGLRELAEIHEREGRLDAAREALERAREVAPFDAGVREQLAGVHAAAGRSEDARREGALAQLLEGTASSWEALAGSSPSAVDVTSFDDLVLSFADRVSRASQRRVVHLGLRPAHSWRSRLLDVFHPRRPDRAAIDGALTRAIERRFERIPAPPVASPLFQERVDALFAFEDPASLDAETVATVNQLLDAQAAFAARLRRAPPLPDDPDEAATSCAAREGLELELRMLEGQAAGVVSVLANVQCLPGDLEVYGEWNPWALGLYAVALLLLIHPLVRGWGSVVVRLKLPPRTKGFFTIRISRTGGRMARDPKRRGGMGERLQRSLRSLSRYERRMAGRETVFRWIPARKRPYTVTVKGPLMDARGEEIGYFLEEKPLRVERGRTGELEYDFSPDECAVEVQTLAAGEPLAGARVAVLGDPASLRYAAEGRAFLYLGRGDYEILVGADDRVAQYRLEIRSLENPIPVCVDLTNRAALLFLDCPEAVDPYLQGDYATAAEALDAAGNAEAAHHARAILYERRGDAERASREYEAAGDLERAAALRAADADLDGSAALFERAGDFARAAEAHRAAGALAEAARCYESAYDYASALECHRELGDDARVLDLLEKTGEYLDAATLARRRGDDERAMRSLQQITSRQPDYGEACKLLAEVLGDRGEFELAAAKWSEAVEIAGGADAPLEMQERQAALLERAGELQRALEVCETIRRRDPSRRDMAERTKALRQQLARTAVRAPGAPARESRYDRIEEIGRGGMGVVWKARDRRLGRLVALKQLPDSLRDHPEAVKLFLREARAAAALNHRNIVTLFDADEEDGSYFITMELLEGRPLSAILQQRGRVSARDTARLGVQIAAGLHYAQQRRIIHRDIKAANLFFTTERVVKIMDFGLARTLDEMRKTSTVIGGTPYYMAPEQAAGEAVDQRADLYAFGVTLFQLATGSVPFRDGDLAYHHRHTPAPDPRTRVADLPAPLAELILELLAKDPDDRCQTAAEAGRRLQALLRAA